DRPLGDVLALGLIAAFFVSPYAQLYDFPVLVIPLVILLGERLPGRTGAILLGAFLLLPYVHAYALFFAITHHSYNIYIDKYLLIIIPALLGVSWCWLRLRRRRPDHRAEGATGSIECAACSIGQIA